MINAQNYLFVKIMHITLLYLLSEENTSREDNEGKQCL